jgi:hypothetical protein
MEVVDDQDDRLVERAQVGQQALDDGLAAALNPPSSTCKKTGQGSPGWWRFAGGGAAASGERSARNLE